MGAQLGLSSALVKIYFTQVQRYHTIVQEDLHRAWLQSPPKPRLVLPGSLRVSRPAKRPRKQQSPGGRTHHSRKEGLAPPVEEDDASSEELVPQSDLAVLEHASKTGDQFSRF